MKKSPMQTQIVGSILLWVLATFETPDQMFINLHIILSLNPGIVEYHPAYFSHCSHTFLVILVRRICLMMKTLVPWSQRFFLKFLFVDERASCKAARRKRNKVFPSLFPSLGLALSFVKKNLKKNLQDQVRLYVLTWFDYSLLSHDLKVNSVIMTVIFK